MINDNYQRELDRINDREIAIIATFNSQQKNLKANNGNGTSDVLEVSRLNMDKNKLFRNHRIALDSLNMDKQQMLCSRKPQLQQLELEKEKMKVKRKEMASKKRIARTNKNRFYNK